MISSTDVRSVRTNTTSETPKEEAPTLPEAFPEGGLRGWATVAGAFLVQFCGFGYTTSFGVYQGSGLTDFYTREYLTRSSASAISWIGSVNALLVISGGLIAGRLYDRGHFYLLLYGGSFLLCFSLFMLSLCKPEQYYQIFLAQGIGAGLGAGTVYVPSVALVSHYFHKRRALAMTLVASGSSLGAVINPIMLNNTIHGRLGFANAVRVSAGFITGLSLIACVLMHPRLAPTPSLPFWRSLRRFSRDSAYVCATLGTATFVLGLYFPIFYLQLDAIKHGINPTLSFYSLVIMNAASFIGRLAPGFVAQQLGIINMVVAASACGAVLILCMIALRTFASVVVIGILYGLCAGVWVTLMAPLFAILTEDLGELGLRMGVAFGFMGIGGLVGPPINGALLTGRFIWWRPALFSGLMAFVGSGLFSATLVIVRRRDAIKRGVRSNATERKAKE
ncbi:major facilitator superfamily domain-containing protein [Mycena belliarum]|uniref:Major facilitator superfamily domain-containing protein n=1 Tax=Mycena belliarum TaxID=1033014 RepID=A0AAD6XL13_9AGAR|nr:major facilitator superfamily domain-containing protein [Mycena belliae]